VPSWIVPSDTEVVGNTGHTTDHNHIADDLTLINDVLPIVSGGLTGATSTMRVVGAIASGTAPASGTFAAGDVIIVLTGGFIICIAAGSPGTWVQAGQRGTWYPSDAGLVNATFNLPEATSNATPTAGTLYLGKIVHRTATPFSHVQIFITQASSGTSTGTYVGFYGSNGALLAKTASDVGSQFNVYNSIFALNSTVTPTPGDFGWIALLINIPTMPIIQTGYANNGYIPGTGPIINAANTPYAVNGTGLTALPSSITPSSNVTPSNTLFWGGVY
jgi:hypothetical protein